MIITLKKGAPKQEIDKIVKSFVDKGLEITMIEGANYNVFGVVGDTTIIDESQSLCGSRKPHRRPL